MLHVRSDVALDTHHSFGLRINAKQFVVVHSIEEVQQLNKFDLSQALIMGEGSNILFTRDFGGLAIQNKILGKEVLEVSEEKVVLRIGGGENWNELVQWTVAEGWGGLENLTLIPGSVGAAPVQNIGAYGVSLADCIVRVEGVFLETGKIAMYNAEDCGFGYRTSLFKTQLKGKFFITHLVVQLTPVDRYQVKLEYPALRQFLKEKGSAIGIDAVSNAVTSIRTLKLPNPKEIGNAGSFFKNPVISAEKLQALQQQFPAIPFYLEGVGKFKIPAAWLIEKAGWKGKKLGNAATHQLQPLVLIALSRETTGKEVYQLSVEIQKSIKETFGIDLEPEVNIL